MNTSLNERRAGTELATAVAFAAVLALFVKQALGLSDPYLFKVAFALGFVGWLVSRGMRACGARGHFGPADCVTLSRAILTVLLLGLLGERGEVPVMWYAFVIAAAAGASDALDGWLARRTGSASDFGARFDMETDAALIAVLALLAWHWERAGMWVLLAGAARYLFVLGTCCCRWMRRELPPSRRRKAVCAVQLATLVASMAPVLTAAQSASIVALGVGALLVPFTLDTLWIARAAHDT